MARGDRTVWLRLNAYGVLIAGLAVVVSLTDLFHPAGTDLARLAGDVPPGQTAWVSGFVMSGVLLLAGFARGDRIAETLGLGLLTTGVLAQAITAYAYLGVTEFTRVRLAVLVLVALCMWARCSVLWSKRGLNIHIPARGQTAEETGDER